MSILAALEEPHFDRPGLPKGTVFANLNNTMKRVLLVGRDPLFAWALDRKLCQLGYHLEHVYTLTEARLRVDRFEYEAFLLDGLTREEVEFFNPNAESSGTVFVFDDLEESPCRCAPGVICMTKETALSKLVPSFKETAQKGHIPL